MGKPPGAVNLPCDVSNFDLKILNGLNNSYKLSDLSKTGHFGQEYCMVIGCYSPLPEMRVLPITGQVGSSLPVSTRPNNFLYHKQQEA